MHMLKVHNRYYNVDFVPSHIRPPSLSPFHAHHYHVLQRCLLVCSAAQDQTAGCWSAPWMVERKSCHVILSGRPPSAMWLSCRATMHGLL